MRKRLSGVKWAGSTSSPVWAVTAYFDPLELGHRIQNFREFRRHLRVPLVAAELAFDGPFHLTPGDANILIQVRNGSLMWQKERLLNLAIEALPKHVEAVAWLDCDTIFIREDWPASLLWALEDAELVQPFRRLYYLSPGEHAEGFQPCGEGAFDAIAYRYLNGSFPSLAYRLEGLSQTLRYAPGMAWAARRDTLASCPIYDAGVLGYGDKLLFNAAAGRADEVTVLGEPAARHYRRWAKDFNRIVDGRIAFLDGDLLHLWHGDLAGRRYKERLQGFNRLGFDPQTDLALTNEGVWRWNSDKPQIHEFVAREMQLLQPERRPLQTSAC